MPCNNVNLIAFDRAFELKGRFLCDNAVAQNRCHFLNRIFVAVFQDYSQLGGDLSVGKIQSHAVFVKIRQAKHPNAKRLAMSREHGSGEVVEGSVAHSAEISLPLRLCFIVSISGDFGGVAVRALDAFGPTKLSNHLVALGVVDQSLNVGSHPA